MTTFTSPHNLPIIEPGVDNIKDSAEASAVASDINAVSMAVNSSLSTEGARAESAAKTYADTLFAKRWAYKLIPLGSNLNEYYGVSYAGKHAVTSSVNAATMTNVPLNSNGQPATFILDVDPLYGYQTAKVYDAGATVPNIQVRARTTFVNTETDAWTPWTSLTKVKASLFENVMQDNKAKVDAFLNARGGSIGTGGLGAVALRFDHNLIDFRDIVLPLLRARNLVWSQAVNTAPSQINASSNGGIWGSTLQGWVINDGGEILGHSHTHADSTTPDEILANVADSLPIFATDLPEVVAELFAPPGTGGTNWQGWVATNTPEYFSTKYAGASAVLKNFAACTGYIPGPLRQLSGQLTNGQTHITLDMLTSSSTVINTLKQAQEMGAGVQLMMHPNALSIDGRITVSVLTEILDYIAAERDAGRLLVLSTSGMLVADARNSYRSNILRGFGTAVWAGMSGWTVSDGVATGTTSAGVASAFVSLSQLTHIRGRVRELKVEARSTAGAEIQLGVTASSTLSKSKNFTVPGNNTWRTYSIPFTIPNSAASLSIAIGRVSGGGLEMRAPAVQPV